MDCHRQADAANSGFHEEYDGARRHEALDVAVLVVMADELVLVRRGERMSRPFTPDAFRVIKAVAHVAVTAYTASYRLTDGTIPGPCARALGELEARIDSLRVSVPAFFARTAPPEAVENLSRLLSVTGAYVRGLLDAERGDAGALIAFAREAGPALLRCTEDATRVQLAALHAHVAPLVARLDPEERRGLQVVVLGDHQARVRSLGMQYFQRWLGEAPGEERRVTYGEGISTVEEALLLVGTRRLDRVLAAAFFGDAARLQRDILGDAVREQLGRFELSPLESGS